MTRIAFFGEPGSGKTTIAKRLAKKRGYLVVEAAKAVIFPLASFQQLPKEKQVFELLHNLPNKKIKNISREKARETFSNIKRTYSSDFIAKALHELYVAQSKSQGIIFSGLRGLDNARYCRLHNDLVIYLKARKKVVIDRLCTERRYTKQQTVNELKKEQQLYKTKDIEKIADLVINTSTNNVFQVVKQVLFKIKNWNKMCQRCVNTSKNQALTFDKKGDCQICSSYLKNFDLNYLKQELEFLQTIKGTGKGIYDVMVGLSGGKDSTATLYTLREMEFAPLAFTFNTGYLPETTIPRAREMADLLDTDHEVIDIRGYLRKRDIESYKKTVNLYEEPFTLETKKKFRKAYALGRKHYSVKCRHSPAFVRTCQLCRRMVIRAYYSEALKRGINAIILGINEWTNLSAAQKGRYKVSGIRKLQPYKNKPPVYVFHLPFLLQRTSKDTKKILDKLGWKPPDGEDFIESNSNSCLFARSTERMAKRLLEFHPDSTRLAREVTVGFITKKQALKALGKLHPYKYTPRQVLERAGIIK